MLRRTAIRLGAVFGPSNAAAMFAAGAVIACALVGGWALSQSSAITTTTPAIMAESALHLSDAQCSGGDPVSAFKCRNTWYANLKSSYR